LINVLHVFFTHTAAMHFDLSESRFDLAKISRRQLNIDCSQVLIQVIQPAAVPEMAAFERSAAVAARRKSGCDNRGVPGRL
jgi:hypothetical protein